MKLLPTPAVPAVLSDSEDEFSHSEHPPAAHDQLPTNYSFTIIGGKSGIDN